jgi:hypothetical protein
MMPNAVTPGSYSIPGTPSMIARDESHPGSGMISRRSAIEFESKTRSAGRAGEG